MNAVLTHFDVVSTIVKKMLVHSTWVAYIWQMTAVRLGFCLLSSDSQRREKRSDRCLLSCMLNV